MALRPNQARADHHLVVDPESRAVGCSCGWTCSAPSAAEAQIQRWRLHVQGARAAESTARARALFDVLRDRLNELELIRHDAASRRAAMVHQRAVLCRQLTRARDLQGRCRTVPAGKVAYLERGRCMAGLEMSSLWLDYVGVGGNEQVATVTAMMHGDVEMTVHEFNLLAVVINEAFADAGMGHPVDYQLAARKPAEQH